MMRGTGIKMNELRARVLLCVFIASCSSINIETVAVLQQTTPPGGVPVCPLSIAEFTCVDDLIISWREEGSSVTAFYTIFGSKVNETSMAGIFRTVLTIIDGSQLTSTATIDRVSLGDDGRNITCGGVDAVAWQLLKVEGVPPASSNVTVTILSTEPPGNLTVNLTWFQDIYHCVEVYQVEMATANSFISSNTTSQHAVLVLLTGQVYSFRVRGVDSANRLGNWSTKVNFTATAVTISSTMIPTTCIATSSSDADLISTTIPTAAMTSSSDVISTTIIPTVMPSNEGVLPIGATIAIAVLVPTSSIIVLLCMIVICTLIFRNKKSRLKRDNEGADDRPLIMTQADHDHSQSSLISSKDSGDNCVTNNNIYSKSTEYHNFES